MAVTINGSTGITTPGITNSGNETVSGNSAVTGNFSVGGSNISPVQSFRNKIINGNFDFWQRGTSVTGVAFGQYLADRWFHVVVGSTANVSRQSFTLGQTDIPNEPSYFHRTVVTSSAGSGNAVTLNHRIESARTLAGQTATLSFWAKADSSKNIALDFVQYFGSGGSPSSEVSFGTTTCALTTSWQKFSIVVSVPSIFGKTLGTDNNDNLGLRIWLDAGSNFNSSTNSLGQQSGTFDIAQVQLEAGPVATPFEVRPPGVELTLCQRYFNKIRHAHDRSFGVNIANSGDRAYAKVSFPVTMRVSPTSTIVSGATTSISGWATSSATAFSDGTFLVNYSTESYYSFGYNSNAASWGVIAIDIGGEVIIFFDAEL